MPKQLSPENKSKHFQSTKRNKISNSSNTIPRPTIPSKENQLKPAPGQIFDKFPIENSSPGKSTSSTKKVPLTDRCSVSKTSKTFNIKCDPVAKPSINHISLADLRDASTSVASFSGVETIPASQRNACSGDISGESSRSPVFYSASDSSLNALSTLNEGSSDSSLMPPPSAPFSYGKKYGNSTKLFVSGRRKTLKLRPKMHLSVPSSMLGAGSSSIGGSGRAKPLKRGSPLASKDSLRLKKKNKVLKVDEGTGVGGSSGGNKRTKARLL